MKTVKLDKIILIIFSGILLLTANPSSCPAEPSLESPTVIQAANITTNSNVLGWGLGLQYTRPCSGIGVSLPLSEDYLLQPIFYINVDNSVKERLDYGLRGIYKLPPQSHLNPYLGIALGHNERRLHHPSDSATKTGGNGYELFFGVAYNKYLFQPSLELALGGYTERNGQYQAGLTLNVGLQYCFQL